MAVIIAILLALRIDTVMRRSKGWQGNGCIVAALMAYATWASHWLDSARIDELLASTSGVAGE
ncbi:hypothetical protein QN239_20510 [Mycolicibacterium sp. Y3]